MNAITLGYHDVGDYLSPAVDSHRKQLSRYVIDPSSFLDHLQTIQQRSAGPVGWPLRGRQDWGSQVPTLITFDDGATSSYTFIAGELEKLNWRGHFFIVSDWIGTPGFINREQIRELHARGHVIGSHSRSHPPRMTKIGRKALIEEWTESCLILGDIVGERIKVASVPNGFYSREVGETAAEAGIEVLFNSEPTMETFNVETCLVLGRYSIAASASPALSGAIAAGDRSPRLRQTLMWTLKKGMKALGGATYLAVRRAVLTGR